MSKTDLSQIVMAELDAFAKALPEDLAAAGRAAAKAAIKELKSTSPKDTGEYAKGWKSKTKKTRTGAETVIYQGDEPGLAHLLEFGHPVKRGGRVVGRARAFPHIKPAEENAARRYEEELRKRIENGD